MQWADQLGLYGVPLRPVPPTYCEGSPPRLVGVDTYFAELRRNFIVFNDQELTMEPIEDSDISVVAVSNHCSTHCANEAWSTDCDCYFIVLPEGIVLFSIHAHLGLVCKKKSALFIKACLDAPKKRKK